MEYRYCQYISNDYRYKGVKMENTLGARFKQIRKSLKMTQKEFAESLGVTQTTISGIEKDVANTSLTLAKLISLKYNISEDWILNGTGQMEYFPREWSVDNISGLMQKLDGIQILFDKEIERIKLDKDKLFNIVESFGFFTSLISNSKLSDFDYMNYLSSLHQLFDELEKYIFFCSVTGKCKSTDFEKLYELKMHEIKLQREVLQIIENISGIYVN